jgi:hypothetical protein
LNRQPPCEREYLWIVAPERFLNEGPRAWRRQPRQSDEQQLKLRVR